MDIRERHVMKWIKENFDLNEVSVEKDVTFPFGKKVTDMSSDYVIVFFDNELRRVNYLFKEQKRLISKI